MLGGCRQTAIKREFMNKKVKVYYLLAIVNLEQGFPLAFDNK